MCVGLLGRLLFLPYHKIKIIRSPSIYAGILMLNNFSQLEQKREGKKNVKKIHKCLILFTAVRANYINQMERKALTVFQYCDSKRE